MPTKLLLPLLLVAALFAADSTYTTSQLLAMIEQSTTAPNITLTAQAHGGYGTPEMFEATPQTDTKAALLCNLEILSTREIRKRKQGNLTTRTEALQHLADILTAEEHRRFLWQQRKEYRARKKTMQTRIKKGFSDQSEIFPLERYLIDIQAKLNEQKSAVLKAQLALAGLAGSRWQTLFSAVKKWNRTL